MDLEVNNQVHDVNGKKTSEVAVQRLTFTLFMEFRALHESSTTSGCC